MDAAAGSLAAGHGEDVRAAVHQPPGPGADPEVERRHGAAGQDVRERARDGGFQRSKDRGRSRGHWTSTNLSQHTDTMEH